MAVFTKKTKASLSKNYVYGVLLVLAYAFYSSQEITTILAGIAIFLVGMIALEKGFKSLAGGLMQEVLQKLTSTRFKALFGGFILTSIVQSSSLVSVICISFLSASLIGLSEAVAVIFGANLGTTTTAWMVAVFGLKIKISTFAMPMLVFGIVLFFNKQNHLNAIGKILLGLGLIFLGISYLKEGFDAFNTIDLSVFSKGGGFIEGAIYVALGALVTVVIQSSSAAMALVLVALAAGQISYESALALAIGSNIGTTVTAVLGSLAASSDGKRLALAHLCFNLVTAVVALMLLSYLSALVDVIALYFQIAEDYVLKLAIFHTLFNLLGIVLMYPFIDTLVSYISKFFAQRSSLVKAKYLSESIVEDEQAALIALEKESEHLLANALKIIAHAISLHTKGLKAKGDIRKEIKKKEIHIDIDSRYKRSIKPLEAQIIAFSIQSAVRMNKEQRKRLEELRLSVRDIVEAVKHIKHMKKNLDIYQNSKNVHILNEYQNLKIMIASVLRTIYQMRKKENQEELKALFLTLEESLERYTTSNIKHMDNLISEGIIATEEAISFMNDSVYAKNLLEKLIMSVEVLYVKRLRDDFSTE